MHTHGRTVDPGGWDAADAAVQLFVFSLHYYSIPVRRWGLKGIEDMCFGEMRKIAKYKCLHLICDLRRVHDPSA